MNLKSMLLALSLIGSTSFVFAEEEKATEATQEEVAVAETTEEAEEKPSCGCTK